MSHHETIEQRARYAIEHPEVAHTPADLREIIAGLMHHLQWPAAPARNLVRYCYECGHVGAVLPSSIDCCPDGYHAQWVHPEVADQAALGFRALAKNDTSDHPEERSRV